MKRRVILAIILLSAAGWLITLSAGCGKGSPSSATAAKSPTFHCPMHPQVTSDKPGDCPICNMRLVPIRDAGSAPEPTPSPSPQTKAKPGQYYCPMCPEVASDKPDICPVCNMKLELLKAGPTPMKELAPVTIPPATRTRMGLTMGTVETKDLARDLTASARIVPDEARLHRMTAKVDGWVEQLFVNTTGQEVKKGDPMLSLYSPDLVSAQQEYLSSFQASRQATNAASPGNRDLLEAARRRLQFWDITDTQIKKLETSNTVEKTMTLHAPANGHVLKKSVVAGQKIMAGEDLLLIADLSTVWAEVLVHQSDLSLVKLNMPADLTLPGSRESAIAGRIIFISPTLDPDTRTGIARIEVPNAAMHLKPGMFAEARLHLALGRGLAIPETAVMRTGQHTYAFREGEKHQLIPGEIKIGPRAGVWFLLLEGLKEGDRVVTSANFLVDSESSMQAVTQRQ